MLTCRKAPPRVFSTPFLTVSMKLIMFGFTDPAIHQLLLLLGTKIMMVPDHKTKSFSLLCHFHSSCKTIDLPKRTGITFNTFKYKFSST